jgi:hypothetical protein
MLPDARRGQNREVYIQRMNCSERVAGHVDGETVVAAGLFQRRGTAAAIGDEGGLPSGANPEWDERIVLVADDEDFLEWQRDWLTDHGRA